MNHDEIRAALAAATPGPWTYLADEHKDDGLVWRLGAGCEDICRLHYPGQAADAHLIAHAPEWLADLLGEVDLLRTLKHRHEQTITELAARAEAAEQAVQRTPATSTPPQPTRRKEPR